MGSWGFYGGSLRRRCLKARIRLKVSSRYGCSVLPLLLSSVVVDSVPSLFSFAGCDVCLVLSDKGAGPVIIGSFRILGPPMMLDARKGSAAGEAAAAGEVEVGLIVDVDEEELLVAEAA